MNVGFLYFKNIAILTCFSGYHVENKPLIKKECPTVTGWFFKFEPVPQI